MNSKSRWLTLILAVTAVALGAFFFSSARLPSTTTEAQSGRTANYNAGNFTFSAPVQMTRPNLGLFYQQGGEPEIKTDIYGNIYLTAIQGVPGGVDLWKSINKGTSFVFLGQPDGAEDKCPTIPQCAGLGGGDDQIDVSTGGYLYVSSLWLGNVTMSTSYDGGTGGVEPGQKWEVHPASAGAPADDRQWVAAYGPQTLYMTYAVNPGVAPPGTVSLFFTKSTDAGKTFSAPTPINATTGNNIVDVEGNLVVDPYNGNIYTAYIPNASSNVINLASSTDNGSTWRATTAYTGPAGTDTRGVFPILAVDKGGNLHLVFTSCNTSRSCHVFLTSSANPGAASPTWLPAAQVDNGSATNTAVEPWVVAGSPGVVDITWLGSSAASPDVVSDWHVFFAQTRNAMSATPTFEQNQAESAVMHDKSICFGGGGCAGAGSPGADLGNRDLLEYYTMTLDPEGNVNIAYADSVNNCPADSCVTNAWFTKQTGGTSSYAPPAPPAPATFATNTNLPGSNGDAEPGIDVDSHGCIYAHAPGDPDTWYSDDNGATFTNVIPGVLPTGGGDEDIITIPKQNGSRDDAVYLADLALADISIRKSTDRGRTWTAPGTGGAAGELDASSDRQWIIGDRINSGANQVLYEMDHELASEAMRISASIDDSPWSPPASGITEPEMIGPNGTLPNTNPGPIFVDEATHMVYGFFTAATLVTNANQPPFGKMPNVWEAVGPGSTTAGAPPGPFVNHAVFKGVFDSPTTPAPPAGTETFGITTANDFPSAAIDKAGNIYVVWAMNNARTNQFAVWFAASHDHGQNFYGPFQVSSGSGSAEMPWIAGGDDGRVDIVFYQTDDLGNPNTTNLHWNAMFAQSLNAKDREPVFTVTQASDHIMHFGTICNQGLLCGSGTRNLLDFFKVAISTDGMAHMTYADTGNANSPSHITYTKQIGGPSAVTNPSIPACVETAAAYRPPYDYDGDAKSDISTFRGPEGLWSALPSSNQNGPLVQQFWGSSNLGDIIIPADYNGDGKADFAIFRPSEGRWYIHHNAGGDVSIPWGLTGDIPVPADYDGDGKADLAVFRPTDGYWYILKSTDGQFFAVPWGLSTDKPVAGDYNGDGKADFAIARVNDPTPGQVRWYIAYNGGGGTFVATQWGAPTDIIVGGGGDFDGDRKADLVVFRPSDGTWYILKSTGGFSNPQWGLAGDIPVAADYDGDHRTDVAIFRPSEGNWYILGSTSGFSATPFGSSTDTPVPSAYNR